MDLLPTNASPLKLHRQAKRLLKSTSRAKEPGWYRRAHELDLQWHLWIGAHSGVSAVYSRSLQQWWNGPDLPPISFENDENGTAVGLGEASRNALHELLRCLFSSKEFGAKAKSLGIVIHLADGLRVRNLAPDFAEDGDFDSLNELLISAPEIAVGDDTLDSKEGAWRLLPLLGVTEGERRSLAVQIPAKLRPIAEEFRRYGELRNLPVVVETRCAALEALSGLAHLHPPLQVQGQGTTLVLAQYEAMTLLFALGNRAELLLVRPLLHRSGPYLTPGETHEVLAQTAALLNIKDPAILLSSLSGLPEAQLESLLESYREQFPNARARCLDARRSDFVAGVPDGCFEFAAAVRKEAPNANESPEQKVFREKWAWQDFYGPSKEEAARIPSGGDLRLLKLGGLAQKVAVAALLAYGGWIGMDFIGKTRSEAWSLSPNAAQNMELEVMKLQKEKREWEHWANLLEKRSEGWLALETLLELFPADGGILLKDASYRAEVSAPEKQETKAGMSRSWSISGFANPEVAVSLPSLGSRPRVAELFNGIAKRNHASYLAIDAATRDLQVTLQQKQGSMPASKDIPAQVARRYRTAFDLSISQSLTGKDDLALNTTPLKPKAP